MKKLVIALFAVTAIFTTVGCDTKSENEKNADKIENTANKAEADANAALDEYRSASSTTVTLSDLSVSELRELRAKYMSSRNKFVSARAHYVETLNKAEKYKDGVKTTGQDSVRSAIKAIDTLIEDIDYRIRKIDSAVKSRK